MLNEKSLETTDLPECRDLIPLYYRGTESISNASLKRIIRQKIWKNIEVERVFKQFRVFNILNQWSGRNPSFFHFFPKSGPSLVYIFKYIHVYQISILWNFQKQQLAISPKFVYLIFFVKISQFTIKLFNFE